jgi:magnesium transporter
MLDYLLFSKGKYIQGKEFKYSFSEKNSKDFLCLFLSAPAQDEVSRLCKDFDVDQKYFEKFKNEKRSLRYVLNPLIFNFTDYYEDDKEEIHISNLLFILKKNLLIMVASEETPYYKDLFQKVIGKAVKKKVKSSAYVFYEFLHNDTKENYDVLETMDDKIEVLEQKIIDNSLSDKETLADILGVKKYLIQMNKRLWASSKIIFTIKKDLSSVRLEKEEMALLDDIYDTLMHQIDLIETQKETLTDFLEIFTTNISNRLATISNELNQVMKKMAALTIIIMVPTLIAGIYGMNFHVIPELYWPYGYAFALILMATLAYFTYYMFHKKGWI